jgi:aspartate/methionine/tyrosine aminotransferase
MPGGKPTMHYAISFYGEPGAEIIYPDPGFTIYESMISYTGAKPIPYNLIDDNNFNIDVDKILSLINDKTRLFIINNPHNPTGSFAEKQAIDKLANGLKNFPNVAILSDEIYGRLLFEKKEFPTFLNYPELYDRLIILDGWSKTYAMTGWRLGWGVWPEKLLKHLFKFCVNNHSCVNAAIQYGAIAALDGSDDSIYGMVKKFILRKNLMFDGLKKIQGINCTEPKSGFFIFPNVKGTGMNGSEFTEKCLKEAGVALIQGTAFGKSAVDNVRINFTTSEENISKALENIKKMLN